MSDIVFTASRRAGDDVNVPISIPFTVGGTATFGSDYTVTGANTFSVASGSMTIPAGQISAAVTISTVVDLVTEPNETIVLTPQAQAGVWTIGNQLWTGMISNDDNATTPILSLNFEQLPPVDATGKTVTANGGYARSIIPYSDTYSGEFNSAWLLAAPSPDWNFGEVTIELWLKLASLPSGTFYPNVQNLVHHGPQNSGSGYALIVENQHLNFSIDDVYVARGIHGITVNNFYKIAYTRQLISGSNYYHRLFVNESKIAEVASSVALPYFSTRGLTIGCEEYGNAAFLNGLIDDLNIYATCLYT